MTNKNLTNKNSMRKINLPHMNPKIVSEEIGSFVIETVNSVNASGCVIGLSGGIDSSTTVALIKNAFDIYNSSHEKKLEVVGYILPSKINSAKDTEDGVRIADILKVRYEVINLDRAIEGFKTTNPEAFERRYDQGNMISRIRANVLSTKAAIENKIIAGTGNKDEDFGVGYYTLFGDGAVHLSPIGGLSKRLVRQMAEHLGLPKDLVYREPTAGLEHGQTDFTDLGYKYDVVELVTEGIHQGFSVDELISHEQIKPLVESQIKMLTNPKLQTVDAVVYDIMRRHEIANAKVKIIHPPAAPITLGYNGYS
jgi:NAD+ synthase